MVAELDRLGMLNVAVETTGGDVHVRLRGEVDISTVRQLERALERAGREDASRVVLDLQAVRFMDVGGLRTIMRARERLGPRLVLSAPSRQVQRIFLLLHFERFLEQESQSARGDANRPDSNVEFVRRLWEAFRSGGADAVAKLVPDGVAWTPLEGRGETLHSPGQLQEFWSARDVALPEATGFSAVGDNVLVRFEVPVAEAGVKEIWSVYRFDGPKLIDAVSFDRQAEALRHALQRSA